MFKRIHIPGNNLVDDFIITGITRILFHSKSSTQLHFDDIDFKAAGEAGSGNEVSVLTLLRFLLVSYSHGDPSDVCPVDYGVGAVGEPLGVPFLCC